MPNISITPDQGLNLNVALPVDQVANMTITSQEDQTLDLTLLPPGESSITLNVQGQGPANIAITQDVVIGGSDIPSPTTNGTVLVYEGGQQLWKSKTALVSEALGSLTLFPVTTNDTASTVEDNLVTGNVLSNDTTLTGSLYVKSYTLYTISYPSGITYTAGVSSTTNPYGVFVMNQNGNWTMTPRLNQAGTLPAITYTVSNGIADATGSLTISISAVNDGPIVGDDTLVGIQNNAATVAILGNDSDPEGNAITITAINSTPVVVDQVVSVTNATVKLNLNGSLTVTPSTDFIGIVSFTYTVTDNSISPVSTNGNVSVTFALPSSSTGTSNYVVSTTTPISFDWSGNTLTKMQTVVEPVTGSTIKRLTNVIEDQPGQVALYNAYSRYPNENVSGEYVLAFAGNSTTSLVMDRTTGGIVATVAYDNTGLGTHTLGCYHEVRWHYLMNHPYRVYYVRGQQFWMIDDVRNQSSTRSMIKDFSTVIDWGGTPDNDRKIYMDQEGNSSLDSDHWAWMAAYYDGSHYVVRAYVHYQVSTDTVHVMYPSGITGFASSPANESARTTFKFKPNMVEVAPDASGIVIHHSRAYAGFQDDYISSNMEAPYFWPIDFNPSTFSPFRIAPEASHSGWSSVDGVWYFVYQDTRRDKWSANPVTGPLKGYGNEGQLDVYANLGAGVIDFHTDGGIYPGMHFGICTGAADGWTFVSTYALQSLTSNGLANTLHMMQIKPEAQTVKWFISPSCNQTPGSKADYNEAPASINLAGTRVITCGDWNGTSGTHPSTGERYIDMYEIALPSGWQNQFTPTAPVSQTNPSVAGTATQGQTLTATRGTWTGYPTPTLTGNWQRNSVDISGATSLTYLIQEADVGTVLRYKEIATNTSGAVTSYSSATSTVVGLAIPVNTVLPSITGNTVQGSNLVGSDGSWTNSPTGYARQWLRNGSPISGATSSNYTLVAGDVGTNTSYRVQTSNALGNSAYATSSSVGPITLSPGTISRVSAVTSTDPSGSAEMSRVAPAFNAAAGNLIIVAIRYDQTGANSITSVTDTAGNTYTAGAIGTTLSGGYPSVAQLWYCLSSVASSGNVVTVTQAQNGAVLDLSVVQYTTSSGSWVNSSNSGTGTDYAPSPFTTSTFTIPSNSVAFALFGSYYSNSLPISTGGDTLVTTHESCGWTLERLSANNLTSQSFTSGDSQSGGYSRMAMSVGVFTAA